MSIKNKYVIHSHISENKFRQIILLFSEYLSVTKISNSTKISRPTINKYIKAIRQRMLEISIQNQLQSDPLVRQIEVDESYFSVRRGRGALEKLKYLACSNEVIRSILKLFLIALQLRYRTEWRYAKIRLVKFKGMDKKMFELHLKECEFRFNNRKQNLYNILLAII